MSAYLLNGTIHVLAALLWLGGMFFLAAVGAPVLRKVEPPSLGADLFRQLGEQFRLVGWIATGALNRSTEIRPARSPARSGGAAA